MALVIIVLRYTGLLSSISVFTNSALLKTGVMDIEPEVLKGGKTFDYNFELSDMAGNNIDISKFKGKVIFLNMWATWCGPCRAEMPSIQELYNKVDHDKVVFIMLSLDKEEHLDKVKKYVGDKSFSFPVYRPSGALPKQLHVPSIPTTFVIGADGKIALKEVGTANYATPKFEKFLQDLVGH